MSRRRHWAAALLPLPLLSLFHVAPIAAQGAPWSQTLRGSWVQAGAPGRGDVVLGGTVR